MYSLNTPLLIFVLNKIKNTFSKKKTNKLYEINTNLLKAKCVCMQMIKIGIICLAVHVGYQYSGCRYIFWESRSTTMSGFDLTSSEIGHWNLDLHHTYNFQEGEKVM